MSLTKLRHRKEEIRKEIQALREKIAQYELEVPMIQSNASEYVEIISRNRKK